MLFCLKYNLAVLIISMAYFISYKVSLRSRCSCSNIKLATWYRVLITIHALLIYLLTNTMLKLISVLVDKARVPFQSFIQPLVGFKLVLVNTVIIGLIIDLICKRIIIRCNVFRQCNYWYRLGCCIQICFNKVLKHS